MDREWLIHALALAKTRMGFTAPNPAVGAVIVREGRFVAGGFHFKAGQPHAEPEALSRAGALAQGATLYVTLEPCCHHGKTPPCTDAIIAAGIKRVVYSAEDPNPAVLSKSRKILESAGIEVEQVLSPAIEEHYRPYTYWRRTGRPFVTLKLAMSLDGKIAKTVGVRTQLSHSEASAFTHSGRYTADALLTTARTVAVDKPRLDARIGTEPARKRVYVLDRNLSLIDDSTLDATVEETILLHAKSPPAESSKTLIQVRECAQGLDLSHVLSQIGDHGVHHLWVEAGGKLASSLLRERLVNRFVGYFCPVWIGDAGVPAFTGDAGLFFEGATIAWSRLGDDGLMEAEWKY